MKLNQNNPELLTVREVAELLNISRRTTYRLVEQGELETIRIGSPGSRRACIRIDRGSLTAFLARRRGDSEGPTEVDPDEILNRILRGPGEVRP